MDDESRQAFEEEKRRIASQKKATKATSNNQLSTDMPFDHPKGQTLGDPTSVVQTRGKIQKASSAQQALMYVHQPQGFVDPDHLNKVYKVVKALYGLIHLLLESYAQKIPDELHGRAYILFGTIATTPIESNKPLVKDEDGVEVDVHEYRSMIGSLMYLTASRPDIMFAVYACARFQVTPKASHLHVVKRIFRYLKHQPKLGLWYPRDSPFELEAFSDKGPVSWQCKKQTIMANSTTKAEYVAAAHCCGQKGKSLEKALKRKSKNLLISKLEGEEPEDQGRKIQDIDDDPLVSLVRESMKEKSTDFGVSKEKSTDKGKRYMRKASNGSTKIDSGTASKRGQREGKAPMVEEDIQVTHKTKEQIRQEEARLEEAIKLQAQLDEEVAKQIHLDNNDS
ncbi:hypothetical protein Tco_0132219 [Tanacetum coccineum]